MVMNVKDYLRQAKENNEKVKNIFNPDIEDFSCSYGGKSYTIHALEIETFPFEIAEHIKKHLANHLLNKRGAKAGNPHDTIEAIKKEIDVT